MDLGDALLVYFVGVLTGGVAVGALFTLGGV
jgi:hypothetical protein